VLVLTVNAAVGVGVGVLSITSITLVVDAVKLPSLTVNVAVSRLTHLHRYPKMY